MRGMSRGALATVLVGASLVAIGMSVWTQVEQSADDRRRARYEACSDRVFDQLVTVLRDTRQVAADERAVTRRLYADIAENPAQFQARIGQYLAELDAAEADRKARPLPLPPSVACGSAKEPAERPS